MAAVRVRAGPQQRGAHCYSYDNPALCSSKLLLAALLLHHVKGGGARSVIII